jgi:hypothetical protein
MYDYAKQHQKGGRYFFGMNETMKFVRKYLGLSEELGGPIVNEAPTIAPIQEPVASPKKRRSLEDFF